MKGSSSSSNSGAGVGWKKWLAIGSGVGVEITGNDLHVMVVRVRPKGVTVLGTATLPDFRERPAADWGQEYRRFVKKAGGGHLAATVMLPRSEVIVRQISVPGVKDQDLAAAVGLQVDALHPYDEDDIAYSFARIGKSASVLVGITRKEVVERYASRFAEAGIKVAVFTFSAAAIYSAVRYFAVMPATGLLAVEQVPGGAEVYGESEARPVYSAFFPTVTAARGLGQALAELRLPVETEAQPLDTVLPKPLAAPQRLEMGPAALTYATAVSGAVPRFNLPLNLLPETQRSTSSRLMYVPTVVLGAMLLILVTLAAAQTSYENHRYIALVENEMKKYDPQARRVAQLDASVKNFQARTQLLDNFRKRSKADLDALNELTRLLPAPNWVSSLDMTPTQVNLVGEAEQATTLLKTLDSSPLFEKSEFTSGVQKVGNLEGFRIKSEREGSKE